MFDRHPQTRREVSEHTRRALERASLAVRSAFTAQTVRNRETEDAEALRAKNRYLVRGRIEGAATVWDVYELQGPKPPRLELSGCAFREEAIAKARDLLLGRVQVSFGGVRAALRVTAGGLISPDATLDTPGRYPAAAARIVVQDGADGDVYVSRR